MIGPELKTLREGRGMDQRAFAEHLNGQLGRSYDKARISRWESGAERIPSLVAKFVAAEMAPKAFAPKRCVILAVANQKGGVVRPVARSDHLSAAPESRYHPGGIIGARHDRHGD